MYDFTIEVTSKTRPRSRVHSFSTTSQPLYTSWDDFLAKVPEWEIRQWCSHKAKKANKNRVCSPKIDCRITTQDVVDILYNAKGLCSKCGSLCVEKRPSNINGSPIAWEANGRRIGSLGHRIARIRKGSNGPSNLQWECLWCNTWDDTI